jgi:hypothetical protein
VKEETLPTPLSVQPQVNHFIGRLPGEATPPVSCVDLERSVVLAQRHEVRDPVAGRRYKAVVGIAARENKFETQVLVRAAVEVGLRRAVETGVGAIFVLDPELFWVRRRALIEDSALWRTSNEDQERPQEEKVAGREKGLHGWQGGLVGKVTGLPIAVN